MLMPSQASGAAPGPGYPPQCINYGSRLGLMVPNELWLSDFASILLYLTHWI